MPSLLPMKDRVKPNLNLNSNGETCLQIFLVPGSCSSLPIKTSLLNDHEEEGNSTFCKLVKHTSHPTSKLPNIWVHTLSQSYCCRHCMCWTHTPVALCLPSHSSHSNRAAGVNSCGEAGYILTISGLATACQFSNLSPLHVFSLREGIADSTEVLFNHLSHFYN